MDDTKAASSSARAEALVDAALHNYKLFHDGVDPSGRDRAISSLEASFARAHDTDSEPQIRLNLMVMLKERYQATGQLPDLERAAEMARTAADLLPEDDSERSSALGEVAFLNWTLYHATGNGDALDEAISSLIELTREAAPDDPKLPGWLTNLSLGLTARYRAQTNPQDMNSAVDYAKRATHLVVERAPQYSAQLSNLAVAYMGRFEAFGNAHDLNDAIVAMKRAVGGSREEDSHWLKYRVNLAVMLSQRYNQSGEDEDFDGAEAALQPAIDKLSIWPRSSTFASLLSVSASLLSRKFEMTGDIRWLNEAIEKRREVVARIPAESPSSSKSKNNLAIGLLERHTSSGRKEDLKEAIGILQDLASSEPSDGVEFPAILFNLSNSLNIEYDNSGKMQLLDKSIDYAQQLTDIASRREQQVPGRFASLAEKLILRHRRLQSNPDIEEAVRLLRHEIRTYPENAQKISWLAHLAVAIEASGLDDEVSNELDETMTLLEEEIQRRTNQKIRLPYALTTLANRFAVKFQKTGKDAHLNKAIQLGEHAVNLTPDGSPEVGQVKTNLGLVLESRYGKLKDGKDLARAIDCFNVAWQSEPSISFHRVKAAGRGVRLLGQSGDAERGAQLAKEVTDFLPILSTDIQDFNDRVYAISTFSGIAADTCALLLMLGRETEALEYMQKGRAVILREIMDSRALSQVQKYDKKLAERYENLRSEANAPLQRIGDQVIRTRAIERRKEARQNLQLLIKNEIREVPGLSEFHFDQSVEEMRKGAEHGLLVIVNISDLRSDAIIVTATAVRALHLPQLDAEEVRSLLAEQWDGVLSQLALGNQRFRKFLGWLWKNGVKQIMAEIENLTNNDSNVSLPRVRWIGSGLATTLPFHAAGDHGSGSTENVLSKAVSSYAPSTRFLSTKEFDPMKREPTPLDRVLIATMSQTPGYVNLPNAQSEGELVQGILGSGVTLGEPQDRLTANQIKDKMQNCTIAHLACHGYVDPLDPSQSGLVFVKAGEGGKLEQDVLTLRQVAELNLQNSKIAFLSACSTAKSKLFEVTDESLTVVSGFQIAGFRHVIGALWPSFDEICKSVAETFYRAILDAGLYWDNDKTIATALHNAILEIRTKHPKQPLLWAQFVHFGM